MSNTILLKRSAVTTHTPTTLQMTIGEVAVNTYDGKMFLRGNNGADYVGALGAHTYTGDLTGTALGGIGETISLTLSNVASAGTYTQVVVNTKGLVTSGSALGSSAVLTALGYTPVNRAGDTMSGTLVNATGFNGPLTGNVTGNVSGTAAKWAASMTLATSGDATGSAAFDGSTATTIALTLATVGSVGTYTKVVTNAKGLVTSGSALGSGDVTGALGFTPVNIASLGVSNGVATLDSSGKLTNAQIPSGLVGAVVYQGTWNANSNSPSLANGSGTKGFYYIVGTAGTTTLNGISQWLIGDTVIYDGATWDKIDGSPTEVSSVNGLIGAVSITSVTGNAGTSSKWAAVMTLATSGDATGSGTFDGSTATTIALTLKNTGTAGTYTQVVTDAQGRVTSGSALGSAAVLTALGYTPVNKAGDTMSGALTNASGFIGNASTATKWNAAMTLAHSGDVTGSNTFDGSTATTIAMTLANSGVTAGTYDTVTVDAKGRVTAGSNTNTVLTGDITGSGLYSLVATLATVNSNVGTWNTVVVNGKGLVTSASNTSYLLTTGGTLSGALTDASGFVGPLTGNASTTSKWAASMTLAHSGDVTGSNTFDGSTATTIAMTLANSGVTAGTYTSYVVNSKGLVTSGVNLSATGDATGTATNSGLALTLASSGVSAGTYIGITVNAKGLVTAVTLPTTVAGFGITDGLTVNSTIDGGSF